MNDGGCCTDGKLISGDGENRVTRTFHSPSVRARVEMENETDGWKMWDFSECKARLVVECRVKAECVGCAVVTIHNLDEWEWLDG